MFCFNCGIIGHNEEFCYYEIMKISDEKGKNPVVP